MHPFPNLYRIICTNNTNNKKYRNILEDTDGKVNCSLQESGATVMRESAKVAKECVGRTVKPTLDDHDIVKVHKFPVLNLAKK